MYNQEEYQTVVDKKLITNELLKLEISSKNEIIKKLNNDIHDRKSCNIGGAWYFHGDSQFMCNTSNSEGSRVKSRDVNIVNTEIAIISINDQLKMVREENIKNIF